MFMNHSVKLCVFNRDKQQRSSGALRRNKLHRQHLLEGLMYWFFWLLHRIFLAKRILTHPFTNFYAHFLCCIYLLFQCAGGNAGYLTNMLMVLKGPSAKCVVSLPYTQVFALDKHYSCTVLSNVCFTCKIKKKHLWDY